MSKLHVVFDLDDTLYPERQYAIAGFRAAARWAEAEFGVPGLDVEMTRLLDTGMLGRLFASVLERHVPHHLPHHVHAFHQAYRSCEPDLTLFPDAEAVLDHFGALGPLGLITDGTLSMQRKKVHALGVEPRFNKIIYTDALGSDRAYFKPHAMAFELMAEALGRPGDRFVYVGDNPLKDFVAPNALGWRTVQVVRVGGIHDQSRVVDGGAAQHTISELTELIPLLSD